MPFNVGDRVICTEGNGDVITDQVYEILGGTTSNNPEAYVVVDCEGNRRHVYQHRFRLLQEVIPEPAPVAEPEETTVFMAIIRTVRGELSVYTHLNEQSFINNLPHDRTRIIKQMKVKVNV